MSNKVLALKKFPDKWIVIGGIFILGILLPMLSGFMFKLGWSFTLLNVFFSAIGTAAMWLGCRFIINKLWYHFPWEKHPVKHLVLEVVFIALYTFIVVSLEFGLGKLMIDKPFLKYYDFLAIYISSLVISLVISFLHEAVFFYLLWISSSKKAERLEKESLLSQFETLKNQVNPHFLFNSFNTLIALIEEDREAAVAYVQKLSDFFRTILQLRDKTIITLCEEIELINAYIFIQKKRYGENLMLNNKLPEASMDYGIAPLTLQMLIENAIKHNVIATGRPLVIELSISERNYLVVQNNLQKRTEEEPSAGLGLQNIRNRYKFLSDKEPEIMISAMKYTVAIPLLNKPE